MSLANVCGLVIIFMAIGGIAATCIVHGLREPNMTRLLRRQKTKGDRFFVFAPQYSITAIELAVLLKHFRHLNGLLADGVDGRIPGELLRHFVEKTGDY